MPTKLLLKKLFCKTNPVLKKKNPLLFFLKNRKHQINNKTKILILFRINVFSKTLNYFVQKTTVLQKCTRYLQKYNTNFQTKYLQEIVVLVSRFKTVITFSAEVFKNIQIGKVAVIIRVKIFDGGNSQM